MNTAALRWESCALTDQGNVRDHNEDACLDAGDRGLWVVADAMGGHRQGDYASQLIVERLRSNKTDYERPSKFVEAIEDQLIEANCHLYKKAMEGEEPQVIGSTVVALLVFDRYCVTTWAGDSRAYRWRKGHLLQVSRDHSEIQELIDQGVVNPEEAEHYPNANVITRAVGGTEELYLDYELLELEAGDRYLLCSDGLCRDVSEAEITETLGGGDCKDAATLLLDKALSRECKDNVTVLVVDFLEPENESASLESRDISEGSGDKEADGG